MMGRTAERRDQPTDVRLVFLERDADEHEAELRAFESRLDRILWALVGILISTATAAILLALNLVVST